jgi:hypothetical protein
MWDPYRQIPEKDERNHSDASQSKDLLVTDLDMLRHQRTCKGVSVNDKTDDARDDAVWRRRGWSFFSRKAAAKFQIIYIGRWKRHMRDVTYRR